MAITLREARKKHGVDKVGNFRIMLDHGVERWLSGTLDNPGFLPRPHEDAAGDPYPPEKMPLNDAASPDVRERHGGKRFTSTKEWDAFRVEAVKEAQRDMNLIGPVYDASHPDAKLFIQMTRLLFPREPRGDQDSKSLEDDSREGLSLVLGQFGGNIGRKLRNIEMDKDMEEKDRKILYNELAGHTREIVALASEIIGEEIELPLKGYMEKD